MFAEFARYVSEHFREIHSRLLEHVTIDQHARTAAAAAFAVPRVLVEFAAAVGYFQAGTDLILKAAEVLDGCRVEFRRGHEKFRRASGLQHGYDITMMPMPSAKIVLD